MTTIEKVELSSFATAGFCSVVAPALAPTHPLIAAIIGGIGSAAVALKGYLSSSPKDAPRGNEPIPVTSPRF